MLSRNSIFSAFLFVISVHASAQELQVVAKHHSVTENIVRDKLLLVVEKYKLSRWMTTNTVVIDDTVKIPRSHPVLTINGIATPTSPVLDELELVAIFVHEQSHWNQIENGRSGPGESAAAIKQFASGLRYEFPYGDGGEERTLNHIPVCYMEYRVLSKLFGEAYAKDNLEKRHYYKDVYAFVLNSKNHAAIDRYLKDEGISPDQFQPAK